jgi:hypothetical protein
VRALRARGSRPDVLSYSMAKRLDHPLVRRSAQCPLYAQPFGSRSCDGTKAVRALTCWFCYKTCFATKTGFGQKAMAVISARESELGRKLTGK